MIIYKLEKKFVILYNDDMKPCIVLGITDYHRNIIGPSDFGEIIGRAGGGRWNIVNKTLMLYGSSDDFGKYDFEMAHDAFSNKDVYYFDDNCYDEFNLKNITME